jgi:hypothetical protein
MTPMNAVAIPDSQHGYRWVADWTDDELSPAMSHTAVAVTDDALLIGATTTPDLMFVDRDGREQRRRRIEPLVELHDLVLTGERNDDLWICDPGQKVHIGAEQLRISRSPGRVVQVDLEGTIRRTLPPPSDEASGWATYAPTAIAIDDASLGGSGDIWVADGYGAEVVRRYSAAGDLLLTLTGVEGGGRFCEPHHILIDRRREVPELYVADRKNGRIQVYGLDGAFHRLVGEQVLPGPTQLAVIGDHLAVTDLLAGRVTLLDASDKLVAHLFEHPHAPREWSQLPDGWPNRRGADGTLVRAELTPGSFHCPHGIAATPDGHLIVTEFAAGGRVTVLAADTDQEG